MLTQLQTWYFVTFSLTHEQYYQWGKRTPGESGSHKHTQGTFLEKYKNYVHKILKMHSQKLASKTGIKFPVRIP
jgi:hypothetical protein